MNVFVLCTGRCGSVSFIEACKHIDNFSCGHETRAGSVGEERLDYPEQHIEADNRLAWYLGRLHFRFGKDAFYVHLRRDLQETAKSYSLRKYNGIMNAFASGLLMKNSLSKSARDPQNLANDICHTIDQNIRHFLIDKPKKITVDLESIKEDFVRFWQLIGANGDLYAATQSFDNTTNSSAKFLESRQSVRLKSRLTRAIKVGLKVFANPKRDISFFD